MEGSRREKNGERLLYISIQEHAGDGGLVYKPDTMHSVLNLHILYTHAYSTYYCRAYVWITSYRFFIQ